MTNGPGLDPPSPFIAAWIARLGRFRAPHARALDLAAGSGRHTLPLATAGFQTLAVDRRLDALAALMRRVDCRLPIAALCADLTEFPLPRARFDVIVVSRYLDRLRLPSLLAALAPDGVLVYETFTERQLQHAHGPRSRAHLLAPGELRLMVRGMEVLFDEEVTQPSAVARIVVRKRARD